MSSMQKAANGHSALVVGIPFAGADESGARRSRVFAGIGSLCENSKAEYSQVAKKLGKPQGSADSAPSRLRVNLRYKLRGALSALSQITIFIQTPY